MTSPSVAYNDIGIVLSGGGGRGIAHIGVLRALAEHGILPDHVAGASVGAIVGALYAAGHSPAEMLEFFQKSSPFQVSRFSLTKPGIIDTNKVRSDFEAYFPDDSFEALPRELRVVATDLTRGEPEVFDSGPLIPALLASSAFPLMFSPVEIDGRLYADGGITSNFPVELLVGRCRTLIGVHVSGLRTTVKADLGHSLAVWRRALEVGIFTNSRAKYDGCSVVLRPAGLARFGTFDTRHSAEIEAIGYEAAIERMSEILRAANG